MFIVYYQQYKYSKSSPNPHCGSDLHFLNSLVFGFAPHRAAVKLYDTAQWTVMLTHILAIPFISMRPHNRKISRMYSAVQLNGSRSCNISFSVVQIV